MRILKNRVLALSLAMVVAVPFVVADGGVNYSTNKKSSSTMSAAQRRARASKAVGAENKLVGVALYDSGSRVLALYGSPDEIQGLSVGSSNSGGGDGSGGSGGGGGSSDGGGAGMGGPRAREDVAPGAFVGDPFSDNDWRQFGPEDEGGGAGGGREGRTSGDPRSGSPGGGGGGKLGGPGGGSSTTESTTFVRWIYKFKSSRYGFVLDKYNKVIQIEAIGLQDAKVYTKRGIGFGDDFATMMKAYKDPDGYEISGDNLVVRYLDSARVAFRLQKIKTGDRQRVTGVVVAAGKK